MKKKRSFFKRVTRPFKGFNLKNTKLIPHRIGRCSSQLDTSFWKVLFGDEDSSGRKRSHVIATVVLSLVASYGMSRFWGSTLANKYPALEGGGLLSSGWGGMLIILLLLTGFNTATLLFLVDRQHRGDDSAMYRIATAIVAFGGEDESQAPVEPDQQS